MTTPAPHPLANVKPDPWMYAGAKAALQAVQAATSKLTEQEMKPNAQDHARR